MTEPFPPFASYLAVGDSMSIDKFPGPGLGAASLLFKNADEVFPEFAGLDLHSLHPAVRFTNLARDGATTHDVARILKEDRPTLPGPGLVTLTLGGNDLLGSAFRPGSQTVRDIAVRIEHVVEQLLADLTPRVLLVATIYDPTDGVGDLFAPGRPLPEALTALHTLNYAIRALATRHPSVVIAEVHDHFLGHGSHHADQANAHYSPKDPTCWVKLNIEPNRLGGSEVRRVFWRALCRGNAQSG